MAKFHGKVAKASKRKSALARLEACYESFKAAGEDKPAWSTTRKGGKKVINHPGSTYDQECKRLKDEIEHLKSLMTF